jgi:hypothetical protein
MIIGICPSAETSGDRAMTDETTPETPVAPDGTVVVVDGPTILAPHDLSDHPAIAAGTIRNAGDTALNRDPNSPNFKRPALVRQAQKKS